MLERNSIRHLNRHGTYLNRGSDDVWMIGGSLVGVYRHAQIFDWVRLGFTSCTYIKFNFELEFDYE